MGGNSLSKTASQNHPHAKEILESRKKKMLIYIKSTIYKQKLSWHGGNL